MSDTAVPDRILGYPDRISVAPGGRVQFMLSCSEQHGPLRAELFRVFCATDHPQGPGLRLSPVESAAAGEYPARFQPIHAGSHAVVESRGILECVESFTIGLLVWPTLPGRGRQTLAARWSETTNAGFRLMLQPDGSLGFEIGDASGQTQMIGTGQPMIARQWYFVAASYDAMAGEAHLLQSCVARHTWTPDDLKFTVSVTCAPQPPAGMPLTFGAREAKRVDEQSVGADHFNGKLERPILIQRSIRPEEMVGLLARPWSRENAAHVVGDWDFSIGISGESIHDTSGNGLDGVTINMPMRGASGYNWSGRTLKWTEAPYEYGAIHFHEDDLTDCRWKSDVAVEVGPEWKSGIYALRVRNATGSMEEHFPFFVRPPKGTSTADAVFLASTATYLAYANIHRFHRSVAEAISGKLVTFTPEDLYLNAHAELGLSTYDTHIDGSGVCYASRLRPDLESRIGGRLWNFALDTLLIDWLEHEGQAVDIVTDEDLHREGAALLAPYRVVLTGSHPEYFSTTMLDAIEAQVRQGGRLMYLGGNGFYWHIAYHPTQPGMIENRRAGGGTRTWESAPEESHLSFTGEPAGTWRSHARPPQRLVGVGFAAQGFNGSSWYLRKADSANPRAAFVFEGVSSADRIGDYGLADGGAAGIEIDRADRALGTPAHALVLASSTEHSSNYRLATEEVLVSDGTVDGTNNDNVRADMVFFETPRGGAVFSTGSISWIGSLSHNNYDNDVSRITMNVLRRFLDPKPLVPPA